MGGGREGVWQQAECARGCVCVSVCVLESSLYALPALLVSVPFVYIWQTCNAPLGRGRNRSEDMVGVAARFVLPPHQQAKFSFCCC